jgi:hypothetical protein
MAFTKNEQDFKLGLKALFCSVVCEMLFNRWQSIHHSDVTVPPTQNMLSVPDNHNRHLQ